MPITFPCACGVTLSVPETPPVYFVRCPKCGNTAKVPHGKKKPPAPPPADPGFEVIDEYKPRSTAFDRRKKNEEEAEWEATPYSKPTLKPGYEANEAEGKRGATKGSGRHEPHEVSEEEFQEEVEEVRKRRSSGKRVFWIALAAVVGLVAFIAAGQLSRAGGDVNNARLAAGASRAFIVIAFAIVALVIWIARQGDDA